MSDLVAFLEARITEDQAEFGTDRAMPHDVDCPVCGEPSSSWTHETDPFREIMRFSDGHELHGMAVGDFIMSMPLSDTSERWLAECKAKRSMLSRHVWWQMADDEKDPAVMPELCDHDSEDWPCSDLRAMAQVYGGHPDFDPTWTL